MNNKQYGVELNLIIDKFKSKMDEAKKLATDFTNKVKGDFSTGMYMDTTQAQNDLEKLNVKLQETQEKLDELNRDKLRGWTIPDSDLVGTQQKIESIKQSIKMLNADLSTMQTSPIAKLGQLFSNLKNNVTSVADKLKQAFTHPIATAKKLGSGISGIIKKLMSLKKESNKTSNSIQSGFSKGVSSLKRFALSLFGVQSMYRLVSKAASSYLAYDQELSQSIQQTWAGLGSFLAPVLEYLVGAFQMVLAYANALVQALTGINFVARANAKAMKNSAKATSGVGKSASKALAPFDELNNINQNTGAGAGGGGSDISPIELPAIDDSKLQAMLDLIDKIKQTLMTLLDPIIKAWNSKGKAFVKSIKNAFNGLANLGKSVLGSLFEVWTNGTGQAIVENILVLFTDIFNIVGQLGQVLANAWNNAGTGTAIIQNIANLFISLQEFVNSIANSLLQWTMTPEFQLAINAILTAVKDLSSWLSQIGQWLLVMYEQYVAPVVDKILGLISKIIVALGSVWDFLSPLVTQVIDIIGTYLEPAIEGICGAIGGIIDALSGVMDFITGVFTGDWSKALDGLKQIVKGVTDTIGSLFTGAWETVKLGARLAWEGIKAVFSSVATFFKNIFTNAWTAVKNVFSVGGKIFVGIKDGIVSAFKTIVNGIIGGINKAVAVPFNVINGTLNKIRNADILGIKPFKGFWKQNPISVPKIPKLKIGTDNVEREGLAYLHKGEKVVPADVVKGGYTGEGNVNNEETNNLLRQLISLIDDKDFSPYITVDDIGKASVKYINNKSRITGESVI